MKYILLLIGCISIKTISAQILVNDNRNMVFNSVNASIPVMGNTPVDNTKEIEITDGSIFFQNDWAKSKIFSEDLAVYEGILTRINLMENKIHYLDSLGKEFIIGTSIRQLSFIQKKTGKEVQFINGNILPVKRVGWYLLLFNDSLSLVKGFKKTLETHTSYGSAPEYSIKTDESYFLYSKGREYEVKKVSDFADVLPAKRNEIEQYLKGLNKKLSREEQLITVATFCNSLVK